MHLPTRFPFRFNFLASLLVALTAIPTLLAAQTLGDTPWTEYFGSSTGTPPNWALTNRISSDRTNPIRAAIKNGRDIIVADNLGLRSAREEAEVVKFMNSVVADDGSAFRQAVFDRAVQLQEIKLELGAADQVLLWAFGNEITSEEYLLHLHSWSEEPTEPGLLDDLWVIPYYVEYYLAPGVQAIQKAEDFTGAEIPVLLGSIGNANNPARREFLHQLLNYEVVGTYAQELAGRRVAQIVDYADIHYVMGKNVHVQDEKGKYIKHLKGSYEIALDEIYDPWVAGGPLRGLWSTEEVGRSVSTSGQGAAQAIVVTARYLHWWAKHGISPEQGRVLLFGTTLGPAAATADLAMQNLYSFLGDTPLVEILDAAVPPAEDWETYVFESVDNGNKRIAFVIPSWADTEPGSFTEFQVDATLWPGEVSATVVVYSLGSTKADSAIVDRDGDTLTVKVPAPIGFTTDKPPSIVIMLERTE